MSSELKPKKLSKNAQKWVDALRGGKYKKGVGHLKVPGQKYCCLGVACDLYLEEKGKGKWVHVGGDGWSFHLDGESYAGALPPQVAKWLGLRDVDAEFSDANDVTVNLGDGKEWGGLIYINDEYKLSSNATSRSRYNFKQIADVIASKPKGLFGKLGT